MKSYSALFVAEEKLKQEGLNFVKLFLAPEGNVN